MLFRSIEQFQPKSLLLAGGVSANKLLRKKILEMGGQTPLPEYTTDNAAMIAVAGYFNKDNIKDFDADANWEIA